MLDIIKAIEVLSRLLERLEYHQDDALEILVRDKLILCLNAIKEIPV